MVEEAELLPRTCDTFRCGYGARSIALSREQTELFVGCKDGSITIVELEPAILGRPSTERVLRRPPGTGEPRAGVRAMLDLGEGWLLVGDDRQSLSLVCWKGGSFDREEPVHPPDKPEASQDFSPVTIVDEWLWSEERREVIVSFRKGETRIYALEPAAAGAVPPFRLVPRLRFPKVKAICGLVLSGRTRLLIAESGALWLVDVTGEPLSDLTEEEDPWVPSERPGLISDVAPISLRDDAEPSFAGAYLSSDMGVFRVQLLPKPGSENGSRVHLDKELLPGLTGMTMAVSQTVRNNRSFLWVSDLAGDVHLFGSDCELPDMPPSAWRRLGFRLESSQVVRSIATHLRIQERDVLVIAQACRSDRIVVNWYSKDLLPGEARREAFDLADLLARGTWRELARRVGEEADARRKEGWTPEAVLADLFEHAGEHPGELAYFLANPRVRLTWSVLREIAKEGPRQRVGDAVVMWTYALIGTIHRRLTKRREQQCLGVIRWLRKLAEQCKAEPEPQDWHAEVEQAVERSIQHVRKWGLFGETYYRRKEIGGPLAALRGGYRDYRKFDYIVYCALLFGRRVDVEAEFPEKAKGPLTPWDVRYLSLAVDTGRRDLVAVSWREGIELYERISPPESGLPAPWQRIWPAEGVPADPEEQEAKQTEPVAGYSRKILLGIAPREGAPRPYILEAPARLEGRESFKLWWIGPGPGGAVEAVPRRSDPLEENELVYSLLELSPGLILVGMQVGKDEEKTLPLVIVHITPQGGLRILRCSDPAEFPLSSPEIRTIQILRNQVLSLAKDPDERTGDGHHVVIVGRGDGQVLRAEIHVLDDDFQVKSWAPVGRLSAPVRALAYKSWPGDDSRPPRVIAGGVDGTVIAYQEVPPLPKDWGGNESRAGMFTEVWATREDGPIARIHSCEWHSAEDGEMSLAVVVTQKGMAVIFLNRPDVDELKNWEEHQRIKVPGDRLGRFSLQTSIFGSDLVEAVSDDRSEVVPKGHPPRGRVARLVVATGEGNLRLLTLYYPKYTQSRRLMFEHIREEWLETMRDGQRMKGSLLRKVESMYAAAPHVPSILVRWLLSPKPTSESWAEREPGFGSEWAKGPANQWIPRHLQPLIELDAEWSAGRSLKGRLQAALFAAREVGDIRLFKEILEVALNRANHQLFEQAMGTGDRSFASQFQELMLDLDKMKGVWLGESGDLDTKVRIVFAKSLVDGDTLWALASVLDDPDKQLGDCMKSRVRQLHRLLATGDPLLALETLRAANLAILRACRRLTHKDSPRRYLHWESIQGYFEAVGDFAARVAHSGGGDMSEAVAHEICRAYAVGMLACPPYAFRLSAWMCEADLPHEFGLRVRLQLSLLEKLLGFPLAEEPRQLFDAVARKLYRQESEPGAMLSREQLDSIQSGGLEGDNRSMVQDWERFESLLEWLRGLANRLTSEASNIGLQEVQSQRDLLEGKVDQPSHSQKFWIDALDKLIGLLKLSGLRRMAAGRSLSTRPDMVLFSRSLRKWCGGQKEELARRKRQYTLFDPQYTMYVRTLDLLETAAAELPCGAALQKNMVLGVLGHSLLERLDEHLLELWEIAQALDPMQTWEQEGGGKPRRPSGSRAAEFASYLLSTAQGAELIPKNLRNLQGLLSYPVDGSGLMFPLEKLFEEFHWLGKECLPAAESLEERTYHFLRLTLRELAQNHSDHGRKGEEPSISLAAAKPLEIRIVFPYSPDDHKRLMEVWEESDELQQPVRPYAGHSKSHGAGLYLANLAAAAVGWKLKIGDDFFASPNDRLPFLLIREEQP